MKRLSNDDTLTKLGDTYHYLVVLEHCLELDEGEAIYVEEHGDVSKISPNDPSNIEVKSHLAAHHLSDRDSEFWNTLKNWIMNRDHLAVYKRLILLTTSTISDESAFYGWDKLDVQKRVERLREIGGIKKEQEKTFRPLFDAVFGCPNDALIHIVGRVELCTGNPSVATKAESLCKHKVLNNVPQEQIPFYIEGLLGYILLKPTLPPHSWRINHGEFSDLLVKLRDKFVSGKIPIPINPPDVGHKTSDGHGKYRFVKEILRIEYHEEVNEAVENYWQAMAIVSSYFRNSYVYTQELLSYENDLKKYLHRRKRIQRRNMQVQGGDSVRSSQTYYDEAMTLTPRSLSSFSDNQQYFQNGIIHSIVDDGSLTWHLEDSDGN